jgi:hypothetical protein
MTDETTPNEPSVTPTTLELLLAEIDAACRLVGLELDRLEQLVEQLHPERTRSCRTAVTLARTGVDEVRDRAHARPLDEPGQ